MISDALLAKLERVTGVSRRDIDVFKLPPARTIFISDHRTFFAKKLAHDGKNETSGIKHALEHHIFTPRLRHTLEADGSSPVLIFDYIKPIFTFNHNPISALSLVWNAPPPATAKSINYESKHQRSLDNLTSVSNTDKDIYEVLRSIYAESQIIYKEMAGSPRFWLHGDFHERNTYLYVDKPLLLDWEWHGVGYREVDAGKWLQTNLTESSLTSPWDFWQELKKRGLNEDLVKLEIRTSAARAYTYQLRWQTRPDWQPNLLALAKGDNEIYQQLV